MLKRFQRDGSISRYEAVESESDGETYATKTEKMLSTRNRWWKFVLKNLLLLSTITAAVLGVAVGFAIQEARPSARTITLIGFPGEILLRLLQMLILPLIVASLISGIAGLDVKTSGKLGVRAVVYYLLTTLLASVLGIVLVVTIQPGNRTGDGCIELTKGSNNEIHTLDAFLDLIRNMFPDNLVEAAFHHVRTVKTNLTKYRRCGNVTYNETVETGWNLEKEPGMNVLGLIVFSVALGMTLAKMGDKGQPLKELFFCLNEAVMRLITVVIWYSPVGIFFLIAAKVGEVDDMGSLFASIGFYFVTVLMGLLFHGIVTLPLIYFLFTRKNPFKMYKGVMQALVFAFGTSSSAATLPLTMKCIEEECAIDQRVSRFVLPVGATINMDGTALYEAVAAIFIAQYNNIALNFGQLVTVSITATAASIGAAAVPQAGLYTMIIVLTAVGLPPEDISLIIVVDWLLDRFRTTLNVMGDAFGAGIVQHLSRKQLGIGIENQPVDTDTDCLGNQETEQ